MKATFAKYIEELHLPDNGNSLEKEHNKLADVILKDVFDSNVARGTMTTIRQLRKKEPLLQKLFTLQEIRFLNYIMKTHTLATRNKYMNKYLKLLYEMERDDPLLNTKIEMFNKLFVTLRWKHYIIF